MTDKVLCPWCGAEMSDGWHENGLGRFGNYLCQECFAKSPDVAWPMGLPKEQFDMLNKATALRRYTPPILCETCGAFSWDEPQCRNTDGTKYGRKECKYWSRKPTDEERSAAKWET